MCSVTKLSSWKGSILNEIHDVLIKQLKKLIDIIWVDEKCDVNDSGIKGKKNSFFINKVEFV